MRLTVGKFSMTLFFGFLFAVSSIAVFAQNSNTATGEMKQTKKEGAEAGKSLGRNVKHGRVVKGSKHFGRHIGKAGKHFGKGTKKAVKKVIS
jgi:hypothetical protein